MEDTTLDGSDGGYTLNGVNTSENSSTRTQKGHGKYKKQIHLRTGNTIFVYVQETFLLQESAVGETYCWGGLRVTCEP